MANTYVLGDDVLLTLRASGTAATYKGSCERNVSFSQNSETVEITAPSDYSVSVYPTYNVAALSVDVLALNTPTTGFLSTYEILTWQKNQQLLDLILSYTDGTTSRSIVGKAYITSSQLSGAFDNVAEYSISFAVTGNYAIY